MIPSAIFSSYHQQKIETIFVFSGYNTIVKIPAGATNIDVHQHSYSGRPDDDNYLGNYK